MVEPEACCFEPGQFVLVLALVPVVLLPEVMAFHFAQEEPVAPLVLRVQTEPVLASVPVVL